MRALLGDSLLLVLLRTAVADADYKMRAVKAFLDEFVPRVEEIAQQSASTEAVLYAKKLSDDERSLARFEHELWREVECWEAVRMKIDERIAARKELAEAQIVKRAQPRA